MISRLTIIVFATCLVYVYASAIHPEVPDQIFHPAPVVYHHNSNPGIKVESGSVSYLVPEASDYVSLLQDLSIKESFFAKLKVLAPKILKTVLKSVGKLVLATAVVIAVTASLISIAVGFTSLLCKYTHLCSFELSHLGFHDTEHMEEAVRSFVTSKLTPDKISSLSKFVLNSIERFEKLSQKKEAN